MIEVNNIIYDIVKNYRDAFDKDEFIGSNGTTYNMKDIKYFIIPTAEMEKILGKSESKKLNTSKITNSLKMK